MIESSHKSIFFSPKRPIFLHLCATCSELPSIAGTGCCTRFFAPRTGLSRRQVDREDLFRCRCIISVQCIPIEKGIFCFLLLLCSFTFNHSLSWASNLLVGFGLKKELHTGKLWRNRTLSFRPAMYSSRQIYYWNNHLKTTPLHKQSTKENISIAAVRPGQAENKPTTTTVVNPRPRYI